MILFASVEYGFMIEVGCPLLVFFEWTVAQRILYKNSDNASTKLSLFISKAEMFIVEDVIIFWLILFLNSVVYVCK